MFIAYKTIRKCLFCDSAFTIKSPRQMYCTAHRNVFGTREVASQYDKCACGRRKKVKSGACQKCANKPEYRSAYLLGKKKRKKRKPTHNKCACGGKKLFDSPHCPVCTGARFMAKARSKAA